MPKEKRREMFSENAIESILEKFDVSIEVDFIELGIIPKHLTILFQLQKLETDTIVLRGLHDAVDAVISRIVSQCPSMQIIVDGEAISPPLQLQKGLFCRFHTMANPMIPKEIDTDKVVCYFTFDFSTHFGHFSFASNIFVIVIAVIE